MKKIGALFVILAMLLTYACNNQKTFNRKQKKETMDTNQLELKVDEQKTIHLPSRGPSGLQLLFTVDDTSLVEITRREIRQTELDSLGIKPGDPTPAAFSITGKKPGTTKIHFVERRVGMQGMPDLPLRDYEVKVTD